MVRGYTVNCNGAQGRYAYVGLPGTNRMLNFAEFIVNGRCVVLTSLTADTV